MNSDLISEVLKVGGVTRGAVDQVLLAGSSCKIPLIQTLMEREFPGCEDVVGVSSQVSPEEAVVVGCALQAGLMRERRESGREEEEEEGMEVACVPCDLWIKVCALSLSLSLSHTHTHTHTHTHNLPLSHLLTHHSTHSVTDKLTSY